jgi:hypothetical protein
VYPQAPILGWHRPCGCGPAALGALEHDSIALAQLAEPRDRYSGAPVPDDRLATRLEIILATYLGGNNNDGCLALDKPCCDLVL